MPNPLQLGKPKKILPDDNNKITFTATDKLQKVEFESEKGKLEKFKYEPNAHIKPKANVSMSMSSDK